MHYFALVFLLAVGLVTCGVSDGDGVDIIESIKNLLHHEDKALIKLDEYLKESLRLTEVTGILQFFTRLSNKPRGNFMAYVYSDTCQFSKKQFPILSEYLINDSNELESVSLNVRSIPELRSMVKSYGCKGTPCFAHFRDGVFRQSYTGVISKNKLKSIFGGQTCATTESQDHPAAN